MMLAQLDDGTAVLIGIVTVGILAIGGAVAQSIRSGRANRDREAAARADEKRHMEAQHQQQTRQQEREEGAFQQHMRLQELTAKKLELEGRLLAAQADNIDRDREIRDKNAEYHDLMVKKTHLEIQSLKLHIKEQLKRGEDFTSYDEP